MHVHFTGLLVREQVPTQMQTKIYAVSDTARELLARLGIREYNECAMRAMPEQPGSLWV